MKKYPWLKFVLAGVGLLLLVVFLGRSCAIRGKYLELKGEYKILKTIADEDRKQLNAVIAAKSGEIEQLTKKIADIIANAGQPSQAEVDKDHQIAELAAKVHALEAQGDLAGALAASKAECSQWAAKFTLAENRHKADIFNLNAAWQAKFDTQVTITDSYKRQLDNLQQLSGVQAEMNKSLERKVKTLQLTGKAKSLLVIAGAAYLGYQAIKGSK